MPDAENQTGLGNRYIKPDQRCLLQLFLTDPYDDRYEIKATKGYKAPGTCQWVLTNGRIMSWLASASPLLWLTGGPGTGKTMLAIFFTDGLQQRAEQLNLSALLYFFCDGRNSQRNTATAVLRGLLFSLIEQQPSFLKYLLPVYEDQGSDLFKEPSFGSLWCVFENMVQDESVQTIFCVLDGIDECKEQSLEMLARKLESVSSRFRTKFRLIVFSRELPDHISRTLSLIPHVKVDLESEPDGRSDIRKFITFYAEKTLEGQSYSKETRISLEEILFKRADGNFLWAELAMNELVMNELSRSGTKMTSEQVENWLKNLPTSLEGMYKYMLLQIPAKSQTIVASILRWVVMAVRPLTLAELGAAIDATMGTNSGTNPGKTVTDHLGYCGNILRVSGSKVVLVHQSAKEYLLRRDCDPDTQSEFFRVRADDANAEIARICFNYLSNGSLKAGAVNAVDQGDKPLARLLPFPLLLYSVFHWPEHVRCSSNSMDDIFDLSNPFFEKESSICSSWLATYWSMKKEAHQPFPLLHLASYFGFPLLASKALKKDRNWGGKMKIFKRSDKDKDHVDSRDGSGHSPIFYAAGNGQESIVQLLLEGKADVNLMCNSKTALHRTAANGHSAVIRLLLKSGAEVNAQDSTGMTALHRAAENGHEEVVKLLINAGSDINREDSSGWTALQRAADCGHEAVAQVLIEGEGNGKVNIGLKDGSGWTALHRAAWNGHKTVIRKLLEAQADPNDTTSFGWTALYAAARNGHEKVVRLLLDAGAEVNMKDKSNRTALYAAVWNGHDVVVQDLLAANAEVNIRDSYPGATVLHIATANGRDTIVQQLLKAGAEVDAMDSGGKTSLYTASWAGHHQVVKLLLEAGANVNKSEEMMKGTALHAATEAGYTKVVELLLGANADTNARDDFYGRTPLHVAAEGGYEDIVSMLLEAGADINSKDTYLGGTALHIACGYSHPEVVKTLLESKLEMHIKDNEGRTPLHVGAEMGNEEVVHLLLLEPKTDINAKDREGNTALSLARANGQDPVVRLLEMAMARPTGGKRAIPNRLRRGGRGRG